MNSDSSLIRPLAHLPFDQALQITPLLDDLQRAAQSSLVAELAQHSADVSSAALQVVSGAMNWSTHAAKFTQETEALLKAGKCTLTEAKNGTEVYLSARNGKGFVENAKLVKGAGAAAKLANVAAIAVNICHVVSGIDTARKVERISKDVQFLREARRVTQLSRLEAIYRHAKELLSGPVGEREEHRLHDLTMSLFELRAEWRRELVLNLDNVKNDQAGWWGVSSREHRQRGMDEEKRKTISRGEVEIQLMDFSIVLQMALAFAAGRHEAFLFVSMPDEIRDWEHVGKLLHEKAGYIKESSIRQGVTVRPLLRHFDSIIHRFQAITVQRAPALATLEESRIHGKAEHLLPPKPAKPSQPPAKDSVDHLAKAVKAPAKAKSCSPKVGPKAPARKSASKTKSPERVLTRTAKAAVKTMSKR